ncbi:N-carbamoyl-L-amino-acid hydrolase [Naumannella cuiyingiana]|uniref:N-carbamoyl-L-amino-acid hydrolase n=1 Tax=Naumannella cuiyingiana TaxID=1347891 RepID=A0A7Z0D902_9ACTN|nr:hydantoinase/carbamoylase family amidase [Naumannella cuiyingiana]NYI70966.1 N-carbamoyl-L-amino-acid hydrolase [Naumannella cuiyingiana]
MTPDAFLADLDQLSEFGATAPAGAAVRGVDRQAATPEHAAARRWVADGLAGNGFGVEPDRIGNLFASIEWLPGAPALVLGSHLDSQPAAGRLDGAYGVLAAAHAATRLAAEVAAGELTPVRNLAVVDWFNEEGARFTPSLLGSSTYTGALALTDALAIEDLAGVSVADALRGIGCLGSGGGPVADRYLELHIEQGRELENAGVEIGVVTRNWAVAKFTVVVHGDQAHTGATALADRHDALVGAARLVLTLRELAAEAPPGQLLASVGRLRVFPNSPVVVPARVEFEADIRGPETEQVSRALREFDTAMADLTEVTAERARVKVRPPRELWPDGVALAEKAAAEVGARSLRLATRAGHDAIALSARVPTVLIFVPSRDGISHNVAEDTDPDHLLAGVEVLTATARRLLRGEPGGDDE